MILLLNGWAKAKLAAASITAAIKDRATIFMPENTCALRRSQLQSVFLGRRTTPDIIDGLAVGVCGSLRFFRPLVSRKKLFDLLENRFHLIPPKRAHRFGIRRLEENDDVISAHGPEFLHDFHSHFLRLGDRSFAAFNCVLDVADSLIRKLN